MTIMSDEKNTIIFSLGNRVSINKEPNSSATYSPEMPNIVCSDSDKALFIQNEINTFVHKLISDLVNEKR